jgi:4-amino-4-deoxychorismate lyase
MFVDEKNQGLSFVVNRRPSPYTPQKKMEGFSLILSATHRNPSSPLCFHKTSNYFDNILALQWANAKGYDDCLFLNHKGEVCETSKANLFCVFQNQLLTPKVDCGLLNGITRNWVINRAKNCSMDVLEECMTWNDVLHSDEIFVTNSAFGICPVRKINNTKFNWIEGGVTQKIMTHYLEELNA